MKLWIRIFSTVAVLSVLFQVQSEAQTKAITSTWSFNGLGLGYEHWTDGKSFIQADLRAELTETFMNRKDRAGATASFTWNIVFASGKSGNGNTIRYFAGPGAIVGAAVDHKVSTGGIFGIKGRAGVECSFDRHITISACLSPTLGMHVSMKNDVVSMRLYRNGLIYGLLPEVGIKYEF